MLSRLYAFKVTLNSEFVMTLLIDNHNDNDTLSSWNFFKGIKIRKQKNLLSKKCVARLDYSHVTTQLSLS